MEMCQHKFEVKSSKSNGERPITMIYKHCVKCEEDYFLELRRGGCVVDEDSIVFIGDVE